MGKIKSALDENTGTFLSILWNEGKGDRREAETGDGEDPSQENMEVFFLARRALKSGPGFHYDTGKAWQKIRPEESGTTRGFFRRVWKYAAVMVLLLTVAAGYLAFRQDKRGLPVAGEISAVLPGCQKAELLLANGETVLLDSLPREKMVEELGVVLKNSPEGGKLHYQVAGAENSDVSSLNTLSVPRGGEYSLFLADGSEIWLNARTSLRFPVKFSADKREVWLQGEAFFKIVKNPRVPFVVHTKGYDVTVLGTTFNVSAYEDDPQWQTTLVEGKVEIAHAGKKRCLKPSEQCSLDPATGEMTFGMVDPGMYTSWLRGKFYFDAYPFEEVVRKLERWYDFTMVYSDESIRRKRFSGTIDKDRPLGEMLHHLERISNLRFVTSGNKIMVYKVKEGDKRS